MSVTVPLLEDTIEPDEPTVQEQTPKRQHAPVVLTPTAHSSQMATNPNDAENGIAGIIRQSSHPMALLCLYIFRIGAIVAYIFSGFFPGNYVLTTVVVVVLLAMDFWNCRNVAGRTLVGLRFWNQVDDDGESYWVFESRDPSRPSNPVDSRMFWIALYTFPLLWVALLIVSFLKLNITFIPIVALALIFNITNAVGFTYADRDAKQRWAAQAGTTWGLNNIPTQLMLGAVQKGVGRIFS